MELQGHNDKALNVALADLAKKNGVKTVVTSDCHYAREEDLWLEEAMLILSTNPKPSKSIDFDKSRQMDLLERFNYLYPGRSMTFQDYQIFLRSAEQHTAMLAAQGIGDEAVRNTMEVANMIGDYPFYEDLDLLPNPVKGDVNTELRDAVRAGAEKRGTLGMPEYDKRREEELNVIIDKDLASYFLIEKEGVQWGREQGILFGPGRGSGAGSLINYELYITDVDPIKYGLLFFRFLDPGRDDDADIDTDVEDRRRSEVKDFYLRRFKNVASISTFGTFAGKESVRSASRVFMVPLGDVNKALKGADWIPPIDWWAEWERTDKGKDFIKKYPEVIRLARFLFGRLRTQGMHAGALVVSNQPISNYAPMQTAKDNGDESGARIPVTAYDMEETSEIGLIKYDFLGLKALSVLSDTKKMIKERHGKDIDLLDIPLDNMRVYDKLSHGYTRGVFQCEATPYTNLLINMGGVKNFDELAASNALVRPGAMKSTAGAAFINRKRGLEQIDYPDACMHDFTKETYGVVIYQEQVMLTMTELAGMSMSEANKVRKIIGKKRDVSEFEQYKKAFIEGASDKVSPKVAEGLWHDFEAHAGYSFNKSHAVAYSMVSYWTAWFKEFYPIEFMTAVLRNEGDKDRVLDYLIETKRMGLRMMLPHVNSSGLNFEIQSDDKGDYIRMGLSNVKYISGKVGSAIVARRPFKDYAHFTQVVAEKGSGLSTRVISSMNAIGGAVFEDNPRHGNERDNFFEYLNIPAFPTEQLPPMMLNQFRDLDEYSEKESFVVMVMVRGIKTGPGWARLEVVDETGTGGIFIGENHGIETGQMYVLLVSNNRVARYISLEDLLEGKGGDFQEFLEASSFPDIPEGMTRVVCFNSRVTKAGKRMADVVLCDETKETVGAMVFPDMFMKALTNMPAGRVVDVQLEQTKDGTYFLKNVL